MSDVWVFQVTHPEHGRCFTERWTTEGGYDGVSDLAEAGRNVASHLEAGAVSVEVTRALGRDEA